MRLLTAVALSAVAAGPAYAGPGQDVRPTPPTLCARALALAAAGETAGCDTLGSAPANVGRPYRQVTVAVQAGAARGTLQCSETGEVAFDVAAPYARSASVPTTDGDYCWITVTALYDGTVAVATSTFAWVAE